MSTSFVLDWVKSATAKFVYADGMREALSLALAANLRVLFSGPGGHGKSEFFVDAFGAIKGEVPFVQQFGQATTPEKLFGGLDLRAFNDPQDPSMRFRVDHSFLCKPVVIFEEVLDAPFSALTSLKDPLTAGELRNGHQRELMTTRILVAATNHSPQEFAELGVDVAALIERFPVQLTVEWPSYDAENFQAMFDTVDAAVGSELQYVTLQDIEELRERTAEVVFSKNMLKLLSIVLSELHDDKVAMSPRTAIYARQLVRAAAAINCRDNVISSDIQVLTYLPGCNGLRGRITQMIKDHMPNLRPDTSEVAIPVVMTPEEVVKDAEIQLETFRKAHKQLRTKQDLDAKAVELAGYLSRLRVVRCEGKVRDELLELIEKLTAVHADFRQKAKSMNGGW